MPSLRTRQNLLSVSVALELPSESKLIRFIVVGGEFILALITTFRRIFGCPKCDSGFFERLRSVMTIEVGVDADADDN